VRRRIAAALAFAAAGVALLFGLEVYRETAAIRALGSATESERRAAAAFLGERRSVAAIPALLAVLQRRDLRDPEVDEGEPQGWHTLILVVDRRPAYVFDALERIIRPAVVPGILEALESLALEELELEPGHIDAVLEALSDRDFELRAWAADALRRWETRDPRGIAALERALEDERHVVRALAALALLRRGVESERAVREAVAFPASVPEERSRQAEWFLQATVALGPRGRPVIVRLLRHPDAAVRERTLEALAGGDDSFESHELGTDLLATESVDAALIPVLLERLEDPEESVRIEALSTLGRTRSRDAVPALLRLWHEEEDLRPAVVAALADIPPGPEALPALLASLEDRDWEVSYDAARALGAMGAEAAAACGPLVRRLEERRLPHAASYALVRIGAPAVEELLGALERGDGDLRSWVAFTLGGMGRKARAAVPALAALLEDPDPLVRANAAGALLRITAEDGGDGPSPAHRRVAPEYRFLYSSLWSCGNSDRLPGLHDLLDCSRRRPR
jgi:HEAT repeat protein